MRAIQIRLADGGRGGGGRGGSRPGARRPPRRTTRPPQANKTETPLERGKRVYEQNCAGCHGNEGPRERPGLPYIYPRPRDFSAGFFKLTSTPQGSLPTDEDLLRTITNGMPGSAMPSWELLSESDRRDAAAYVKTLVRFFDEDEKKWVNRFELEGR